LEFVTVMFTVPVTPEGEVAWIEPAPRYELAARVDPK
jgi:hypothetical protein